MSTVREALDLALAWQPLGGARIRAVLDEILDGGVPPSQVAALLIALRMKGETADELTGGVKALLARAIRPEIDSDGLLDTAGTGGDGRFSFNISTGAALIAAAAGVRVAKHGNRAASSSVGAADLLEHVGVRIEQSPAGLAHCLREAGICFIFAPHYHPALASVGPLRRELGVRTIFNLLGALANPCQPGRRLLGVGERRFAPPVADALRQLGVQHAMVVHSEEGMDEFSAATPTAVWEILAGEIRQYTVRPEELGIHGGGGEIAVRGAAEAAAMLRAGLAGKHGAAQDVLAINGGAAIYLGGRAASLAEGVAQARAIMVTGAALEVLERLRQASHEES
jgi:anthranilate phosphoribosyltransferase